MPSTAKEIKEAYEQHVIFLAHRRWEYSYPDCNYRGEEPPNGEQFSLKDLSGAVLHYLDLSWSDLVGSDLSGAFIYHTVFSGAYLWEASFKNAHLKKDVNMNKHNPRNMEGFLKRVESAFGILLDRQFCYRTNPNLTDEQRKLEEPSLLETKAFVVGKCKNYLVEWQNWENKNNKGS